MLRLKPDDADALNNRGKIFVSQLKFAEALKSKGTREGFETETVPNKDVTDDPVLEGQLNKQENETVDEYAKELADKVPNTKKLKCDDVQTSYV